MGYNLYHRKCKKCDSDIDLYLDKYHTYYNFLTKSPYNVCLSCYRNIKLNKILK